MNTKYRLNQILMERSLMKLREITDVLEID